MSTSQHWDDQTFWATPRAYDALDLFNLDFSLKVEFVDPEPGPFVDAIAHAHYYAAPFVRWQGRIYISKLWWTRMTLAEREEVVMHEAGHVVTDALYGKALDPHGVQWQSVMQRLGYPAREFIPLEWDKRNK